MSISYNDYNTKYRLPEQLRDETLLMKNKHHILCYEPGKGKSMPIIHCIQEVNKLKNGNAKVLIMSDATCLKEMWKAEIVPMNVLPKDTFMVTDRTAIGKVQEALLEHKWDIIICDECQSLRSGITRGKSKYAKLVYQLCRDTEYVWGMTGTIAGNNDIEPFCVLHALHVAGLGKIRCSSFKRDYCNKELVYGPFGAFQKPTSLNESGEALMKKAYQNGCSFWNYDDNDDMPEMKIDIKTFEVPITEAYKNALDGILKCGEFESTVMKAAALQKAQQTLNGFVYYKVECDEKLNKNNEKAVYSIENVINPKIDYVKERCLIEPNIIVYRFQEDERLIKKALDDVNISYTNSIGEFKDRVMAGEKMMLILQCSQGKAANIQVCQNIIYYTSDFSFISYKQMIHRCWRRGQEKPCSVTFLVNEPNDKHKIERKIWLALRNKQSIHDLLMNIKGA